MKKNIIGIVFFVFSFFLFRFSLFALAADDVKSPNVAGTFYPADKAQLEEMIEAFFDQVEGNVVVQGDPAVLISPHAGYIYSGPVAAYGYKALKGGRFDTVVILAPSHYYSFFGAAVYPKGSFRTPLGDVCVDNNMVQELIKSGDGLINPQPQYFEQEHSLETQLPFLQAALKPGFKIVPLILGGADFENLMALAGVLAKASKSRSVLVVASTDLSHYKTYGEAIALDEASVQFMKNGDAQGLWDAVAETGWNVCGVRPVVAALLYAQEIGASRATVLKVANSGDTAGDKGRVVGYASILFTKDKKAAVQTQPISGAEAMLTKEDKKRLLAIARETVAAVAAGKTMPRFSETTPGLNMHRGVFVTLHENSRLRGCIGLFTSSDPLYKAVSQMAAEAASHDYRFNPVEPSEVPRLEFEISVLSPPAPCPDWRKIRLGVDGVIVKGGMSSGVFLPQVATETGWDLETFLGELCSQKAGLDREYYKRSEAKIFTFQAEVFSEKD